MYTHTHTHTLHVKTPCMCSSLLPTAYIVWSPSSCAQYLKPSGKGIGNSAHLYTASSTREYMHTTNIPSSNMSQCTCAYAVANTLAAMAASLTLVRKHHYSQSTLAVCSRYDYHCFYRIECLKHFVAYTLHYMAVDNGTLATQRSCRGMSFASLYMCLSCVFGQY